MMFLFAWCGGWYVAVSLLLTCELLDSKDNRGEGQIVKQVDADMPRGEEEGNSQEEIREWCTK